MTRQRLIVLVAVAASAAAATLLGGFRGSRSPGGRAYGVIGGASSRRRSSTQTAASARGRSWRSRAARPSIDGDDTLAWALARTGRCAEARHALSLNPHFSTLWAPVARGALG